MYQYYFQSIELKLSGEPISSLWIFNLHRGGFHSHGATPIEMDHDWGYPVDARNFKSLKLEDAGSLSRDPRRMASEDALDT